MIRVWPFLLVSSLALTAAPMKEKVYCNAVTMGGQIVPLYDRGYLVYLHQPNRLEVHRPDGQLAYNFELPCPGEGSCSAAAVAVNFKGNVAVSFGYSNSNGRAAGIRIMNPQGKEIRFISTSLYVPTELCFDKDDNLWALGWLRDSLTRDAEEKQDYPLVRKFSAAGAEIGQYLPRSLWPNRKAFPGAGGRGYWRMSAASDRIGAVIHENYADSAPEFVEWNLDGKLIRRTVIPDDTSFGRAYTSDGRFYVRVREKGSRPELRVFEPSHGTWKPVSENLPERIDLDGTLLLGADGEELVYRVGHGNTRLVWARPGVK
jgi:hypothetical protein